VIVAGRTLGTARQGESPAQEAQTAPDGG